MKARLPQYLQLLEELDVRLGVAIDTHIHADHLTALGDLREATGCVTVMGAQSQARCVTKRVVDGEILSLYGIDLRAMHTPGHTSESYSFFLDRGHGRAVFTGDVLLIRGTGRTDFQGGDPRQSWSSIVDKLFALPDDTLIYPGHDYKGCTVSSIGEERRYNPRIANRTQADYVELMSRLNLPKPDLMDMAVPANLSCGRL